MDSYSVGEQVNQCEEKTMEIEQAQERRLEFMLFKS
jgi:hypothetical protein